MTFEVATGRHLACSSAAVTGTQIHNAVPLAQVSPRMLISSCLQQQLTTLLAVVCVYCCANTKATDRGVVYIALPHRPSSATQHTSLHHLPRCNSSVTVVTDRGVVYIALPHRPSSATQYTSLYRLPRCNSSVSVVTSIQVARAGKSGFDFR